VRVSQGGCWTHWPAAWLECCCMAVRALCCLYKVERQRAALADMEGLHATMRLPSCMLPAVLAEAALDVAVLCINFMHCLGACPTRAHPYTLEPPNPPTRRAPLCCRRPRSMQRSCRQVCHPERVQSLCIPVALSTLCAACLPWLLPWPSLRSSALCAPTSTLSGLSAVRVRAYLSRCRP